MAIVGQRIDAEGRQTSVELYVPLAGLVDVSKEVARLEKALAGLAQDVGVVNAKLARDGYAAKAPPEVVQKDRDRLLDLHMKRSKIEGYLASLREAE